MCEIVDYIDDQYQKDLRSGIMGVNRWTGMPLSEYSGSGADPLTQFLPRQQPDASPAKSRPVGRIRADWDDAVGRILDTWRKLAGIGSAKQILYREVQEQLEEVQRESGFEYVKFHGLFFDDMMVVNRTASSALE